MPQPNAIPKKYIQSVKRPPRRVCNSPLSLVHKPIINRKSYLIHPSSKKPKKLPTASSQLKITFSFELFARVQDIPPRNLALVHEVVHALQLGQANDLEGRLDETAAEEVEGLGRVAPVADVGALDGDHLDDGLEDGGFEVGAGGEADADDGAAGADVLLASLSARCLFAVLEKGGLPPQPVGRASRSQRRAAPRAVPARLPSRPARP